MTPILFDFARKSGFTLCKEESALREMLEQFAKFIIEHEASKQPDHELIGWATAVGSHAHVSWGKDRPDYPIRYEVPLYTCHQSAKEKAPQSANCEAPGGINSDHARMTDYKANEKQEPVANASAWFALVMNAAAELEDASHCLRDEDAKRMAISGAKHYRDAAKALYTTPPAAPEGMEDFLTDLERSRTKYPKNGRMFDGLMGEVDELRRAYAGDGDVRAEAFDVAVCAFRIATEGDAGGNTLLATPPAAPVQEPDYSICPTCGGMASDPIVPPAAQRQWVSLTDEEIIEVARDHYNPYQRPEISFARAIEAKLREKNGGKA